MKKTIPLVLLALCIAMFCATVQAATKYWDIDGSSAGAGSAAPAGIWDTATTSNWSTDSTGASAATTWTTGDDAVFSAGSDATNAFAITVDTTQTAGNLTIEEGTVTFSGGTSLNIGGGVAGKGIINVSTGLTATIVTSLEGGDDTGQIIKTGAGTLVLNGSNPSLSGNVIVSTGILKIGTSTALGTTLGSTVVSNGATLQAASSVAVGEPLILYGTGVGNIGALRCSTSPPQANGWSGGATLGSDARINMDASGTWTWTGKPITGTNNGNNFNLTIGGNGGSLRGNVATGARTFILGSGSITKEGGCELRLETPNIAGALYFNSGHILSRSTSSFLITTNGTASPIYVGAGAGQFRTGSAGPSYSLGNDISLNSGANPVFNPDATFSITSNGEISGAGGLTKSKQGTLILNGTNTYSGNTTITAGTLTLGATGSISNTTIIDVQSGATLDLSAVPGGFTLGAAQTIKGNGTILGNVLASGALSPGASVGTLTFNGDLTVAGNLFIEVNKSLSPSNDLINVTGILTNAGTGTLTVTNAGFLPTVGDVFKIFSQPLPNGGALTLVSSDGVQWTNNLAVDGTIQVLSAPSAVAASNLTVSAVSLTSYSLSALGAANSTYFVLVSTNIALPMANWSVLGATTSSGGGLIQFTDLQATNSQRFYRLEQ